MSARAEPLALGDVVLAQLDELDILDDEWLRVSVGPTVPAGTWTTPANLLAPDAQGRPGVGLALLVDRIVAAHPGVEPTLVWSTVHLHVLWCLADLDAKLLARGGRIVRFTPGEIRLLLDLVGPEPAIRGLHLTRVRLAVGPDDPLAGHADVEVLDDATMHRRFVDDLLGVADPVIETVRSRAKVGRRALWGQVLDAVVHPVAERRSDDRGSDDVKRRVDRVLDAVDGTPLHHRIRWVDFEHRGDPHCALRSTACCLAYQWPADPGEIRRIEGGDPRWDRYCQSCPLIPTAVTVQRARFWIDRPDGRTAAVEGASSAPDQPPSPPPEVPS